MASEQFSLCWDNFHKNMSSGMNSLLESGDLVDVTLAVEGKFLKAHKMVLSVCSPYFKELFKTNPCQHPIVFMKDVSYVAISDLLQFMYQGEVQVSQDNLTTFIKTAEALQIKGLTGDGNGSTDADSEPVQEKPARHIDESYKPSPRPKKQLPTPVVTTTPAVKRPRLSASSNDSQSAPIAIAKTEPSSTGVDSSSVQFKVEPYDLNQSVTIPDDGDDNFDENLDDNTVDDTEDYSMMEGEEPQAGTSTDGTGEGQDHITILEWEDVNIETNSKVKPRTKTKRLTSNIRFVADGFAYHTNAVHGEPPLRYLTCAEFKKMGCRGRATIPLNGKIDLLKITQPHNHLPDVNTAERLLFLIDLKNAVRDFQSATLKSVYHMVCANRPTIGEEISFGSIKSTMHRWRKNPSK
ncbi:protein tramtrack, beta isoform-like isoform X15 [Euwallacea fornicatus]|uniref:protein tramtrack, beta isoform-like isoform X15 n=1 Tax=Euwallacea fornicatus TaxID=995702 RepID=UPI00338F7C4E